MSVIVAGAVYPWKHLRLAPKEKERPLIGLATHESIEMVEAHPTWPLVKRPCQAQLVAGSVVVLSNPRRSVAVVFENPANGGAVFANDGVVTWVSRGHLRDHAKAD